MSGRGDHLPGLPQPREAGGESDVAHGVVVVTLVSDVPASRRSRFVGIDNVTAGRTAASLLRFRVWLGRHGTTVVVVLGLVIGSLFLREGLTAL